MLLLFIFLKIERRTDNYAREYGRFIADVDIN